MNPDGDPVPSQGAAPAAAELREPVTGAGAPPVDGHLPPRVDDEGDDREARALASAPAVFAAAAAAPVVILEEDDAPPPHVPASGRHAPPSPAPSADSSVDSAQGHFGPLEATPRQQPQPPRPLPQPAMCELSDEPPPLVPVEAPPASLAMSTTSRDSRGTRRKKSSSGRNDGTVATVRTPHKAASTLPPLQQSNMRGQPASLTVSSSTRRVRRRKDGVVKEVPRAEADRKKETQAQAEPRKHPQPPPLPPASITSSTASKMHLPVHSSTVSTASSGARRKRRSVPSSTNVATSKAAVEPEDDCADCKICAADRAEKAARVARRGGSKERRRRSAASEEDCVLCEDAHPSGVHSSKLSRSSSRRRMRKRRDDSSASTAPDSVVQACVSGSCSRWSPGARPQRPIYRHVLASPESESTDGEGGRCIWDSSDSEGESRRRNRARQRRERRAAKRDDVPRAKQLRSVRFIDELEQERSR